MNKKVCLLAVLVVILITEPPFGTSIMLDYSQRRSALVTKEHRQALGGDISLTPTEKQVNSYLLSLKHNELNTEDCAAFKKFTDVGKDIKSSGVFKFIRGLPKGGSLHSHMFASASFDFVFNTLLKKDNLYLCDINGRLKLKFLGGNNEESCELVATKLDDGDFQEFLKDNLTLNSKDNDKNLTETWDKFKKIFTLSYDLFTHTEVFEEYIRRILIEHLKDNVSYIELKAPFVYLYETDGLIHDEDYFIDKLYKIKEKFKKHHKNVDMKFIYAPYRKVDYATLKNNLEILRRLMVKYPNFIIGVDFVGFEGDSPLSDQVAALKEIDDLNIYVHAGETNNYGDAIDDNLIDAILLGSKRIGHAFSLSKHPELLKLVKDQDIAIEICPISNQILKLVDDLRNHPGAGYIAAGLPIVICNDDPGNWGAEGLSYDWYYVFMAMTHRGAGLEFLKKLAMNSIRYSGMTEREKDEAFRVWEQDWNGYIDDTINNINIGN